MAIKTDDLIKDYYEQMQEKYDLSLSQVNDICKAPFLYLVKMFKDTSLPTIMFKYFGKFVVFPGKVNSIMKALNKKLTTGEITQEEYDERIINLENFMRNVEETDASCNG